MICCCSITSLSSSLFPPPLLMLFSLFSHLCTWLFKTRLFVILCHLWGILLLHSFFSLPQGQKGIRKRKKGHEITLILFVLYDWEKLNGFFILLYISLKYYRFLERERKLVTIAKSGDRGGDDVFFKNFKTKGGFCSLAGL